MVHGREQVDSLKPWSGNPRKISDQDLELLRRSMEEYGDLSGIVFNIRTGHLVGGHQRIRNLDPKWEIRKYAEKDKTGTVARGVIIAPWGKFDYREVDWPLTKEKAANLAANKISGEWDAPKLALILEDLQGLPEIELTGFSDREIKLLTGVDMTDSSAEGQKPFSVTYEVVISCENEQKQKETYEHLTGLGYTCRVLTL